MRLFDRAIACWFDRAIATLAHHHTDAPLYGPTVPPSHRPTAFTLVETAVSMVVVSLMLVAALNAVSASRLGEYKTATQNRALTLAQDLITEIQQQAYEDPNGSAVFGVETGEASSDRSDFDDVDDYHNWNGAPPEQKNGSDLPDLADWERSVEVAWVEPTDLTQTSASDKGVKRITVTVENQGVPALSLTVFRSSAWPILLVDGGSN